MKQYKQNSNNAKLAIVIATIGLIVFNIINVIVTISKH
jgi:hypothetical protein